MANPVAQKHDIRLPPLQLDVFIIRPRFDVNHESRVAVVRRRAQRLIDGGEVPAAVLRHHQIEQRLVHRRLQQPPIRPAQPRREPAAHSAVLRELLAAAAEQLPTFLLLQFLQQRERVAEVARDPAQPAFDEAARVVLAVRESVEAGVLVRHGAAEESLQVGVVLLRRGGGREICQNFVQLGHGVGEELEAVFEGAELERLELLQELAAEAAAVGGGVSHLFHCHVDRVRDYFRQGLAPELRQDGDGGDAEVRVQCAVARGLGDELGVFVNMDFSWGVCGISEKRGV